jgi:hypothetical protein
MIPILITDIRNQNSKEKGAPIGRISEVDEFCEAAKK